MKKGMLLSLLLLGVLFFSVIALADSRGNASAEPKNGPKPTLINAENSEVMPNGNASVNAKKILAQVKERNEERKEQVLMYRSKYTVAKQKAGSAIADFNSIKERLRNANASDKNKVREEVRVKSREILLNQVDAVINKLRVIAQSENAPDDINSSIDFFEGKKLLLENGEISKKELIDCSKEIAQFWNKERHRIQIKTASKLNEGINGLVNKSEAFSKRIEAMILTLQENGKDTSELELGLAKLNDDLTSLKGDYSELRQMYSDAETKEDTKEIIAEANSILREMNKQIIEDFKLIKSMFKAVRELNSSDSISEATATEIEGLVEGEINE